MRIVIFYEIEVVRIGLEQIIQTDVNNTVVASFCDTTKLNKFLEQNQIDILVTGVYPDDKHFIEFLNIIRKNYTNIRVLIFTDKINEFFIFNCLKTGVLGFIENVSSSEEIIEAVKTVAKNEEYFSANVSNIILKSFVEHIKNGEEISEKKPRDLTRREIQILKLVSQGLTNQQIADGLFISIRTVNAHKSHIMQKLQLKTTADLIRFAIKNEYVKL